jgi:hypothetical protein
LVVMLTVVWGLGCVVTSIERTAYPRFKRLITAHELRLFSSPTREECEWAADATDGDVHLPTLQRRLKSYQRMGCFPALEDAPEQVVEFVRRQVELRRERCRCTGRRADREASFSRPSARVFALSLPAPVWVLFISAPSTLLLRTCASFRLPSMTPAWAGAAARSAEAAARPTAARVRVLFML